MKLRALKLGLALLTAVSALCLAGMKAVDSKLSEKEK